MTHLAIDYMGNGGFEASHAQTVEPARGEVQVDIAYTGICGSDLKIAGGAMDARFTAPWPIGHEMAGTVAVVGHGVQGWSGGEKVAVMPLESCGTCAACRRDQAHICHRLKLIGVDRPGSLQERLNVRAELLYRIPDEVDLKVAALTEPLAVAVHDVRRSGLAAGERAVVIGAGPVGLLIALLVQREGADVLISEHSSFRLGLAQELGLDTVDVNDEDLPARVMAWSDDDGADVAFEVSGSQAGMRSLTDVLTTRGRGVVVGIHPEPKEVDLLQLVLREQEIQGVRVYEPEDFATAAELIATREIPADDLISDVVPLSEATTAIERLDAGDDVIKILVRGD